MPSTPTFGSRASQRLPISCHACRRLNTIVGERGRALSAAAPASGHCSTFSPIPRCWYSTKQRRSRPPRKRRLCRVRAVMRGLTTIVDYASVDTGTTRPSRDSAGRREDADDGTPAELMTRTVLRRALRSWRLTRHCERNSLTLDHALFAGRTGAVVRIAVVDSGIAPAHPHVGDVAIGVSLVFSVGDTLDRIGHGTAVAAAIGKKRPTQCCCL